MTFFRTSLRLLVCVCVMWTLDLRAQQASAPAASQDQMNQQLLTRIQDLEKQVQALKSDPPAPAPEPAPEQPSAGADERLKLRVFGDLGFAANDGKGRVSNTFRIGSVDLFMTSRLSDKASLLGELLFISSSDNSIGIDVERLLFQYRQSDYFGFGLGRYHSSIGYYNTAFHQGAWFETTVDRPFMYAFDDQGGFLPLQEVGVTTYGRIPSGKWGLNYVAEVGNGRNHLLDGEPAQNAQDANNGKSVNVAVFSQPAWVPGLQLGFSLYHDYLTFSDNINHSEFISTVHAVYITPKYEFLNEAMLVRHDGTSTGTTGIFHTPAFYTEFSRGFGKYRPYFRYQYINAGTSEPIYGDPTDGPVVGRRQGPSAGVRYDFNQHAAFKLQYDRTTIRGEGSTNGLATQFAFIF
jgi:hypothetical protein